MSSKYSNQLSYASVFCNDNYYTTLKSKKQPLFEKFIIFFETGPKTHLLTEY